MVEKDWHALGPNVRFLPFPLTELKRPLWSKECKNCHGFCTGHYMHLEEVLTTDSSDLPAARMYHPSTVIKESFEKAKKENKMWKCG